MHSVNFPNTKIIAGLLVVLTLAVGGCATKVTRMDAAEVKDLSGAWNDTDSQQVSAEMIRDVLERPWVMQFNNAQKRHPAPGEEVRQHPDHPGQTIGDGCVFDQR